MTATTTCNASWPTWWPPCRTPNSISTWPSSSSSSTTSAADALTPLVNDVARARDHDPEKQRVVVLDDYHAIDAPEVHEAVAFLLDHLPDQLHLVMATRSDPPFPLARMRSRGQLTELRAVDLRFTPSEAREFLNKVMRLELTDGDVEALEDRTEGWIAGLQLAALSLRGIEDRDAVAGFIEAFTGSNRFVIDYLADEVLARQDPRVRDFLLRTAVLERLTGSLCDAVTGDTDGRRTLEDLERGNLFVCRSTRNAPGTATTTCSPTCSRHVCSLSTPNGCRSCTSGPARGSPLVVGPKMPSGTRSRPRISIGRGT